MFLPGYQPLEPVGGCEHTRRTPTSLRLFKDLNVAVSQIDLTRSFVPQAQATLENT